MSDDLDMLAAEYVLGTLDAAERAGFERRLAGSEPARRAVEEWTRRLGPLALASGDVEPPAGLWDRIEERIASQGRVDGGAAPVVAANDNRIDEFRRSARGWRLAFAAATALAASRRIDYEQGDRGLTQARGYRIAVYRQHPMEEERRCGSMVFSLTHRRRHIESITGASREERGAGVPLG